MNVSIIEGNEELNKLLATTTDFIAQAKNLQNSATDEKVKKKFQDNVLIMERIQSFIIFKLRQDPLFEHYKAYKFVVCSDNQYKMTQAIGFINPKTEGPHSHLESLATAYWNISQEAVPHKVKGAGTSIVKFTSALGKKLGGSGEIYLTSAESAKGFYEKLNFKVSGPVDETIIIHQGIRHCIKRFPMFLNAEDAALLNKESETPKGVSV